MLSASFSKRSAAPATAEPNSVRPRIRLRRRTSTGNPSSSSRSLIWRLMAGCDALRLAAAAEMFIPCRTIARRKVNCWSVTLWPFHYV